MHPVNILLAGVFLSRDLTDRSTLMCSCGSAVNGLVNKHLASSARISFIYTCVCTVSILPGSCPEREPPALWSSCTVRSMEESSPEPRKSGQELHLSQQLASSSCCDEKWSCIRKASSELFRFIPERHEISKSAISCGF